MKIQHKKTVNLLFAVWILMASFCAPYKAMAGLETDPFNKECDALSEIDKEQQDIVDGIRSMEEEEKAMKHDFIVAIQRKGFPVNATKLINNYFTLAKKDPEKAYQTLITNPLYFSPIQMDRLPKKFFGLIPAGPKVK